MKLLQLKIEWAKVWKNPQIDERKARQGCMLMCRLVNQPMCPFCRKRMAFSKQVFSIFQKESSSNLYHRHIG